MAGGLRRWASVKPVPSFNEQGTQHTFVFALARDVGDHAGFGIFMGFDLEQVIVACAFVQRCTPVQHQAFATGFHGLAHAGL
mgnify:CR=1 FL=1